MIGADAFIKCFYTGSPQPEVSWYFLNVKNVLSNITKSTSNIKLLTSGLRLINVTKFSEGWYTCVGRSKVGTEQASAYLQVVGMYFFSNLQSHVSFVNVTLVYMS